MTRRLGLYSNSQGADFQFFNQHQPNGKSIHKLTITLYKLNEIQLCHKPIIIYQYDSESTMQFKL